MIKSISYWSMEHGLDGTHPISDALECAAAHGFLGLELCIGLEGVLTPESTHADCVAIRSQVDASGILVETLASGMSWTLNPVSDDPDERDRAIQVHLAAIERAADLGCMALLFVPGVVKTPSASDAIRYDLAIDRARHVVGVLLERAERLGVDLCLENVWNGMLYSPLEFAAFVDSFGSRRLGVYLDVGNLLGYHQHPPDWVTILDKRIKRVHVKDFKTEIGSGDGFCDLLEGDMPWKRTIEGLKNIGYDGTVVAEMMPWDSTLLERTSRAMDKILRTAQ